MQQQSTQRRKPIIRIIATFGSKTKSLGDPVGSPGFFIGLYMYFQIP